MDIATEMVLMCPYSPEFPYREKLYSILLEFGITKKLDLFGYV